MKTIESQDWRLFQEGPCVGTPMERMEELRERLSLYLDLLYRANERVNLTAIRDWHEGVWKHLYDSLLVAPFVPRGTLLDWGTGGGTPGIPVALWRAARGIHDPVILLDSVNKKVMQVEEILRGLDPINARAVCSRGEAYLKGHSVDAVVMRAVAPADRAVRWMSRTVPRWVFMVGPASYTEWRAAEKKIASRGFLMAEDRVFSLPQGLGQRHILVFQEK